MVCSIKYAYAKCVFVIITERNTFFSVAVGTAEIVLLLLPLLLLRMLNYNPLYVLRAIAHVCVLTYALVFTMFNVYIDFSVSFNGENMCNVQFT